MKMGVDQLGPQYLRMISSYSLGIVEWNLNPLILLCNISFILSPLKEAIKTLSALA